MATKTAKKSKEQIEAEERRAAHFAKELLPSARLIGTKETVNDSIITYRVTIEGESVLRKDLASEMPEEWLNKLKV